jgi:antitoxin YefM
MDVIKLAEARARLGNLVVQTAASHQPIIIMGKQAKAVLISEEDWQSIQETLHLLSIPGMRESIREGLQTPIDKCARELDW